MSDPPKKPPARISMQRWLEITRNTPALDPAETRFRDDDTACQTDQQFFGVAQRIGFRLTTASSAEIRRACQDESAGAGYRFLRMARYPWGRSSSGDRYAAALVMPVPIPAIVVINGYSGESLHRAFVELIAVDGLEPELIAIPWEPVPRGS